jgi:hypothetical protein
MTVPTRIKLCATFLPIALSPLVFRLGPAGQAGFVIGLLLGSFFGITLALPFRRKGAA